MKRLHVAVVLAASICISLTGCGAQNQEVEIAPAYESLIDSNGVEAIIKEEPKEEKTEVVEETPVEILGEIPEEEDEPEVEARPEVEYISWDSDWEFADYAKLHGNDVKLYRSQVDNPKYITICVNAGHGAPEGEDYYVQCHPDGSPKIISGSTSAGKTSATAVADGMTFSNGTPEREITLKVARIFRDVLLSEGYDVLMIREDNESQLDNIARTVFANNCASCHIALHYDSTDYDKGAFYMSVPQHDSYINMYPVSEYWKKHDKLGDDLILGLKNAGRKIFDDGEIATDLVQMSYSTVPSVDIELGDKTSDTSEDALYDIAYGLLDGVNIFFEQY